MYIKLLNVSDNLSVLCNRFKQNQDDGLQKSSFFWNSIQKLGHFRTFNSRSTLTIFLIPVGEKHPHVVMLPSPCFAVGL